MEIILLAGMVITSVALVAYGLMPSRGEEKQTLLRRVSGRKGAEDKAAPPPPRGKDSSARRIMEKVAPFAMRPVMPKSDEEMSTLRVKLSNAGFRHESASTIFLASKTVLGIVLGVGTLAFAWSTGNPPMKVFGLTASIGGLGFMLPNIWLWMTRKQRSEKISNGLPDSLDLMVVSVEAGLALDAALLRVGDEMRLTHPELSEELTIATLETQMGIPRVEALENLATRTGVPEMKSLVAIITQAERFGTSIAKALRNQANALRTKRQQKAEERAQATTVKLMLPLILFIFPSIFVVLVGPAALRLIRTMGASGSL